MANEPQNSQPTEPLAPPAPPAAETPAAPAPASAAPASAAPAAPSGGAEKGEWGENLVRIYRCAKVVKGGRRFSFGALVVTGNRGGEVGWGYAKAREVPQAVEKSTKTARRAAVRVGLAGNTIPHSVTGSFGASRVKLIPAAPGTGVIAGASVRAVLELAGVRDCLTKAYGSTNPKNLVKATMNALEQLRSSDQVERLRGVSITSRRREKVAS